MLLSSFGRPRPVTLFLVLFLIQVVITVFVLFGRLPQEDDEQKKQVYRTVDQESYPEIIASKDKEIEQLKSQLRSRNNVVQEKAPTLSVLPEESPLTRYRISLYVSLPSTSVYCYGQDRSSRWCRFRNLYYYAKQNAYVVVAGSESVFVNVPRDPNNLLDLTSLSDHSVFYWHYDMVLQEQFANVTVRDIPNYAALFSRFHVGNIMHTLHDDIMPLYYRLKEFAPHTEDCYLLPADERRTCQNAPFRRNVQLIAMDPHSAGDYGHLFSLLSDIPLLYKSDLQNGEAIMTRFRDATVGNSKVTNWYQYGFGIPQGPIANKTVSGTRVREVVRYMQTNVMKLTLLDKSILLHDLDEIRTHAGKGDKPSVTSDRVIVIFSRRRNRLLINEQELADALEKYYGVPVQFLRMEDQPFKDQVAILSRAILAVGLHGSMLIMAMFLPPGAALVELFPYAVPSNNYTPFATMSRLKGMQLGYRAWENKHKENNKSYPDRPAHLGGIAHLPEKERKEIETSDTVPVHFCCTNPYWLHRIYQDTKVVPSEIIQATDEALKEAHSLFNFNEMEELDQEIVPTVIGNVRCTSPASMLSPAIQVEWDMPWNGVPVHHYGVWNHQNYIEATVTQNRYKLQKCNPGQNYDFWIRAYYSNRQGQIKQTLFSEKLTCECPTLSEN